MENSKCICICSGGLDSTVLYYQKVQTYGLKNVKAINFNYGSKHNKRERQAAMENIPGLITLDIDLSFLKSSSLINQGVDVPHGHYEEESMKSTVVPFRNGIMLSYAVAMAEELEIPFVFLGSHAGDHAIYPDCRETFTKAFSLAAMQGTYNEVRVVSDFQNLSKGDIVSVGMELGINEIMYKTWTCYEGQEIHCGECGACFERKEAFQTAGLIDLTRYKK